MFKKNMRVLALCMAVVMLVSVVHSLPVQAAGAPQITTTSLPNGVIGTAYEYQIEAINFPADAGWDIIGGNLPPGLVYAVQFFVVDGLVLEITGTPTQAGTFFFTVMIVSEAGVTLDSAVLSITVYAPLPTVITTTSLPDGMVGVAYEYQVEALNLPDDSNFWWDLAPQSSSSPPPGLSIDPFTGMISGVPTTVGSFYFLVDLMTNTPAGPDFLDWQPFNVTITDPNAPVTVGQQVNTVFPGSPIVAMLPITAPGVPNGLHSVWVLNLPIGVTMWPDVYIFDGEGLLSLEVAGNAQPGTVSNLILQINDVDSAPFSLVIGPAPDLTPTVIVGSQASNIYPGATNWVGFPVTVANIPDGTYPAVVANLPAGVVTSDEGINIVNGFGTLWLWAFANAQPGTVSNLTLTITGVTSNAFSLVIGEASEPELFLVTVNGSGWLSGTGSNQSGAGGHVPGSTVTIRAGTRSGYTFNGWTVNVGGVTLANANNATTTFTMPSDNVTVTANWEPINEGEFTLTLRAGNGGTVAIGNGSFGNQRTGSFDAGDEITIRARSNSGYSFMEWTYSHGETNWPWQANTTFTMPNRNITVWGEFSREIDGIWGPFVPTVPTPNIPAAPPTVTAPTTAPPPLQPLVPFIPGPMLDPALLPDPDPVPVGPVIEPLSVNLNGSPMSFSGQPAVLVNGVPMIPIGELFSELGYQVQWDEATRTATMTRNNLVIVITEGGSNFTINGVGRTLRAPTIIVNDHMMVPFVEILEGIGGRAHLDTNNTVNIFITR